MKPLHYPHRAPKLVFFIISMAFLLSWLPILYMTTAALVLNRLEIVPGVLENRFPFHNATNSLVNSLMYAFVKPVFKLVIRKNFRIKHYPWAASMKAMVLLPYLVRWERRKNEEMRQDKSKNREQFTKGRVRHLLVRSFWHEEKRSKLLLYSLRAKRLLEKKILELNSFTSTSERVCLISFLENLIRLGKNETSRKHVRSLRHLKEMFLKSH